VGTGNGYLIAYNGSNGSVKWSRSIASVAGFNVGGCTAGVIRSSPAVGLLRAPGNPSAQMAVVVGVGDNPFTASTGGVIAFDAANGQPLWWKRTSEYSGSADGCPDGVVASPTVTDVDQDGRDEVMFGSFDHGFYILRDDGSSYPSWPQWFLDTHWSSPAVGDIDRDGHNEIIIASDEGRQDLPCPYPLEWPQNYCGGSVYAMRLDGTPLTGFPYYTWQIIQSQPALADLNGDGYLDIIFGTGAYYDTADSFKLYVIDRNGQNLPNWPVNLQGVTSGEPAIGDLDGNGSLEVVMGTSNYYCFQAVAGCPKLGPRVGWVYALRSNGTELWPARQMTDSNTNVTGPILAPIIADYDANGDMDILYSIQWEVQAIDGDTGAFEIGGYNAPNNKIMYGGYTIQAAPAVGDINGDGIQEVVAAGASDSSGATGAIHAWRPSSNTGAPAHPWPMFRRNAAHTGRFAPPTLTGGPVSLSVIHPLSDPRTYTYVFVVQNTGDEAMTFSTSDTSSKITVAPASTSVGAGQTTNMTVTLSGLNSYGLGLQSIGSITMQGTYSGGTHATGSPRTVDVKAIVASSVSYLYLPMILK
jgi:hypothetical protein